MKIVLVFPPHTDPSMPTLALPTLAAVLRRDGHSVVLRDENLNVFETLLSRDYLRNMQARCLMALEAWQLDDDDDYLHTLLGAALVADEVIDRIDDVLACLRSRPPVPQRLWAQRLVGEALRLISAVYYPTRLTLTGFVPPYSTARSAEVLKALHDIETNPFLEIFKEKTVPSILAEEPDVVGISVTFSSQLIPALTLVNCVRTAAKPGKPHLILGGGLITRIADDIRGDLLRAVDSFGLFEGEVTLPALLHALETGASLRQVPNLLVWLDGERVQTTCRPFNPRKAPPPDFDGFPLGRYLSPEPVIPIQTARGCYWSRCTFCALHAVDAPAGPRYRQADLTTVVDHLARMTVVGCRRFFFVDECIPPSRLRKLASQILARGLKVRWFCWARFEPGFDDNLIQLLVKAGCALISFGLESAVPKVLDRMGKGISLEETDRILEACSKAGLAVVPSFFIGFPGETREQAEQTLDFVLRNRHRFRYVVWGQFWLERFSPIEQQPDEYGLIEVEPVGDLATHSSYQLTHGMSLEEVRAIADRASVELRSIYHPMLGTLVDVDAVQREDFLPRHQMQVPAGTPLRRSDGLRMLLWSTSKRLRWSISNGTTQSRPPWEPDGAMILDRITGRRFSLKSTGYKILQACNGRRDANGVADALEELGTERVKRYFKRLLAEGLVFPVTDKELIYG